MSLINLIIENKRLNLKKKKSEDNIYSKKIIYPALVFAFYMSVGRTKNTQIHQTASLSCDYLFKILAIIIIFVFPFIFRQWVTHVHLI